MVPRLHQRVAQSLLDRLTDREPLQKKDPYVSPWEEERILRAAIRRDLAALLNCRRAGELPVEFASAQASLLTFGIPDYTAFNLGNPDDREKLRASIERAVRLFEPRLTRVSVALENETTGVPSVRFHIDALLRAAAAPATVRFDAAMRADNRRFEVTGEER